MALPPDDTETPTGERRSGPRHPITLRIDYKRLNTFFADYAKNISKGGTFIHTSTPLDVGTVFVFVLSLPDQPSPLELRGEVMWTVTDEQASDDRPAGMGIRIRFADESERVRLEQYVEKLLSDTLGKRVATKVFPKG
jgi:type IV pilus assembly protein PilZ